jgi:hypothetical protein
VKSESNLRHIDRKIGRIFGNLIYNNEQLLSMPRGQTTSLTKANKNSESLRTTVPASIINQFELEEGDQLLWILEPYKNKLFIKIKPIKKSEKD